MSSFFAVEASSEHDVQHLADRGTDSRGQMSSFFAAGASLEHGVQPVGMQGEAFVSSARILGKGLHQAQPLALESVCKVMRNKGRAADGGAHVSTCEGAPRKYCNVTALSEGLVWACNSTCNKESLLSQCDQRLAYVNMKDTR